jgi:hypothetical protein
MLKNFIITCLLCFSFSGILAQADSLVRETNDIFVNIETQSMGNISFSQNDSIHNLVLKHIAYNKRKQGISGYRINIYRNLGTHARRESKETRVKFHEKFPDIPVYMKYDSPYFKVYVGDFRTKIEAIKSLKKINKYFPSAFIVPDQINYPELD